MTQQVKEAYRKNGRATFFVVLAIIVAAAVAIPLAIGAPDKPYTLSVSTTNPAWKSNAAGPPQIVTLCAGEPYTLELTLTDKSKSQSLGSADIRFPDVVTVDVNSVKWSGGNYAATATKENDSSPGANTVSLRFLDLPRNGGFVKFTVTLTASASPSGPLPFEATVKQANDFNDGGDANIFNPEQALPKLKVETCTGTIKGTVWNDKNEDGKVGTHAVEPRQTWNVYLYRADNDTLVQTVSANEMAIADTLNDGGGYTFNNVALHRDYVVCVGDPGDGSWAQSKPKPDQSSDLCTTKGHEASGYALNDFATVTGIDFGNVNTIAVDCNSDPADLRFTTSTNDSTYTVQIASGTLCGKSAEFVFEAYVQGDASRVANLHPVSGGSGAVHIVEKMEWAFTGTAQPYPASRSLKYDDDLTDNDGVPNEVAMPYCLLDPRDGTEFGLDTTTGVLPAPEHTSCLIESTETAGGARVDYAYSSVDGYRLFP